MAKVMKKSTLLPLYIGFLILASSPLRAQPQKSLIGFQGLAWGSSIAAVKSKFPQAKEIDFCKSMSGTANNYQSLKSMMAENNTGCINLAIENYMIDGIKFYAEWDFDSKGRLKHVNLKYIKAQSESQDYLSECTSAFNRVVTLLESRYGEYSLASNADELGKYYASYLVKAWSPLPSEVWVANLSGDKILKQTASATNKPESDICRVQIRYSKKVSDEASKL
jgi:hypothetical protein